MFSSSNDSVFDDPVNSRLHPSQKTKRKNPGLFDHAKQLRRTPEEWVRLGEDQIMRAMATSGGVDADAGVFASGAPLVPTITHVPTSMTIKERPPVSTDAGVIMQTTSTVPDDQHNTNSLADALT